MKANKFISKKEYKLLLIVAFIAFIFAFTNCASDTLEKYNQQIQEEQIELKDKANGNYAAFSVYDNGWDGHPLIRFALVFLTVLIFLALRKTRKFIFSMYFTIVPFLIFIRWFIKINYAISTNETAHEYSVLDRIFTVATTFDYIVFLFVSILLFWQISILLRMLIKTLQRKTELP